LCCLRESLLFPHCRNKHQRYDASSHVLRSGRNRIQKPKTFDRKRVLHCVPSLLERSLILRKLEHRLRSWVEPLLDVRDLRRAVIRNSSGRHSTNRATCRHITLFRKTKGSLARVVARQVVVRGKHTCPRMDVFLRSVRIENTIPLDIVHLCHDLEFVECVRGFFVHCARASQTRQPTAMGSVDVSLIRRCSRRRGTQIRRPYCPHARQLALIRLTRILRIIWSHLSILLLFRVPVESTRA